MTRELEPWQEKALARVYRRLLRHLPNTPGCSGQKVARFLVYEGAMDGCNGKYNVYAWSTYWSQCGMSSEKRQQLLADTSAVVGRTRNGIRAPEGWFPTQWYYSLWFWRRYRKG